MASITIIGTISDFNVNWLDERFGILREKLLLSYLLAFLSECPLNNSFNFVTGLGLF